MYEVRQAEVSIEVKRKLVVAGLVAAMSIVTIFVSISLGAKAFLVFIPLTAILVITLMAPPEYIPLLWLFITQFLTVAKVYLPLFFGDSEEKRTPHPDF